MHLASVGHKDTQNWAPSIVVLQVHSLSFLASPGRCLFNICIAIHTQPFRIILLLTPGADGLRNKNLPGKQPTNAARRSTNAQSRGHAAASEGPTSITEYALADLHEFQSSGNNHRCICSSIYLFCFFSLLLRLTSSTASHTIRPDI